MFFCVNGLLFPDKQDISASAVIPAGMTVSSAMPVLSAVEGDGDF